MVESPRIQTTKQNSLKPKLWRLRLKNWDLYMSKLLSKNRISQAWKKWLKIHCTLWNWYKLETKLFSSRKSIKKKPPRPFRSWYHKPPRPSGSSWLKEWTKNSSVLLNRCAHLPFLCVATWLKTAFAPASQLNPISEQRPNLWRRI